MARSEASFPEAPEGLTRVYNGHNKRASVKLYGSSDLMQMKSFEKAAIEPGEHYDFKGNAEDCFYAHVFGRVTCKTSETESRLGFLLTANKTYVWDGDAKQLIPVQEYVKRHGVPTNNVRKEEVVFVYPPVGAQKVNMGLALFQGEPVYREAILACDEVAAPLLPMPLVEVLYPDESTADLAGHLIDQACFAQPCLFAVSYARTKLFESRQIRPTAVMGHSVGEYAAAVAASVMDMPTAVRLLCERGRLTSQLPAGGAMISVRASRDVCEAAIQAVGSEGSEAGSRVAVAASNGPTSTVVSGDWLALRQVLAKLPPGTETMRVKASHADHSPCNDAVREGMLVKLRELFAASPPSAPAVTMISTLTGAAAGDNITSPEHWALHATSPVLFGDGFSALMDAASGKLGTTAASPTRGSGHHRHRLFVELGTGTTLSIIRGADCDEETRHADDSAAFAHCLDAVVTPSKPETQPAPPAERRAVAGILKDLGCQASDDELAKVVDTLSSALLASKDSKEPCPMPRNVSEAALGA